MTPVTTTLANVLSSPPSAANKPAANKPAANAGAPAEATRPTTQSGEQRRPDVPAAQTRDGSRQAATPSSRPQANRRAKVAGEGKASARRVSQGEGQGRKVAGESFTSVLAELVAAATAFPVARPAAPVQAKVGAALGGGQPSQPAKGETAALTQATGVAPGTDRAEAVLAVVAKALSAGDAQPATAKVGGQVTPVVARAGGEQHARAQTVAGEQAAGKQAGDAAPPAQTRGAFEIALPAAPTATTDASVKATRPADAGQQPTKPQTSPVTVEAIVAPAEGGAGRALTGQPTGSPKQAPAQTADAGNVRVDLLAGQVASVEIHSDGGPSSTEATQTIADRPQQIGPEAGIAGQIAAGLRNSPVEGRQEVTIRLSPPELGSVRLTIQADGKEVRGVLEVDNSRTLGELQREAPLVAARLADGGLAVRRMDVVLSDANARGNGNGSSAAFENPAEPDGSGQRHAQGQAAMAGEIAAAPAEQVPSHPRAPWAVAGEGQVNIWI